MASWSGATTRQMSVQPASARLLSTWSRNGRPLVSPTGIIPFCPDAAAWRWASVSGASVAGFPHPTAHAARQHDRLHRAHMRAIDRHIVTPLITMITSESTARSVWPISRWPVPNSAL